MFSTTADLRGAPLPCGCNLVKYIILKFGCTIRENQEVITQQKSEIERLKAALRADGKTVTSFDPKDRRRIKKVEIHKLYPDHSSVSFIPILS